MDSSPSPHAEAAEQSTSAWSFGSALAHLIFGVVLPVTTLVIEMMTGLCGSEIIDPVPTLGHVAAVGFVPVANLVLLALCFRRNHTRFAPQWWVWIDRGNAWAAGIALSYALLFLPLTPIALLAVPLFGFGLLPLAPLLSLISALRLRRNWRRLTNQRRGHWSIVVGLLLAPALYAPHLLGDWATHRLDRQPDSQVALFAIRHLTPTLHLWRKAQTDRGWAREGEWLPWSSPRTAYERAYYRATGRSAHQPDNVETDFWHWRSTDRERGWDWDQGEQTIGHINAQLKLKESRLEARTECASATGYVEWTLRFENLHQFEPHEARALIQLPAGGVVSRLTLWIDGEEREAAFGGSSQVTQAYKTVVQQQRRDPVLVTDRGADRVLMQCFPVPPRGGLMKVRLGVTFPLPLAASDRARVVWPRFIARNFTIDSDFSHAIWLTSTGRIAPNRYLPADRLSAEQSPVTFLLPSSALANGSGAVEIACAPAASSWAAHPSDPSRHIQQTIAQRTGTGSNLAIVLDGSACMADIGRDLARALENRPPSDRVSLWFSGDRLLRAPDEDAQGVARWLRGQEFVGGQDDTRALEAAFDEMRGRPNSAILWIHGPQPHAWTPSSALVQRVARPVAAVALLDYSAGWSGSPLLEEIAQSALYRRIDPQGNGPAELNRLLHEVIDPSRATLRTAAIGSAPTDLPSSSAITRLWVREEVDRLMQSTSPNRADAVALARQARVVTRVTGAVVLETQAQYDAAGLKPGESGSGPNIPEPATVVLLAGLLATGFAWRARRSYVRKLRGANP